MYFCYVPHVLPPIFATMLDERSILTVLFLWLYQRLTPPHILLNLIPPLFFFDVVYFGIRIPYGRPSRPLLLTKSLMNFHSNPPLILLIFFRALVLGISHLCTFLNITLYAPSIIIMTPYSLKPIPFICLCIPSPRTCILLPTSLSFYVMTSLTFRSCLSFLFFLQHCFAHRHRVHPGLTRGPSKALIDPRANLTPFCLFYSYLLQTPVVLEQVSAFLDHPHYPIFSLVAQLLGLTFKFVQSTNAIAHVPVSRNRVLLCCEPGHNTPRGYLPPWHFHLRTPTLQASHYLPSDSPHLLDDALIINSEELETLRDPALVPSWYPLPSAPALQRRLRSIGDTLGAIMSSYPRQTSLPSSLLRTNGLYTELVSSSPSHVRSIPSSRVDGSTWLAKFPLSSAWSFHRVASTRQHVDSSSGPLWLVCCLIRRLFFLWFCFFTRRSSFTFYWSTCHCLSCCRWFPAG